MTFAGLATFASIFLIGSMLLTWAVLNYLRRKAILDMPNHRSSHAVPTPRGGGLAVTPLLIVLLAGVFAFAGVSSIGEWLMLAACAGLGLLSWFDDRHDLSAAKRFALQFVAVIIGMLALFVPLPQFIGFGILAIMIGFLTWNWHLAKLFLGDVGSILLGFVLGWLLLKVASEGGHGPSP